MAGGEIRAGKAYVEIFLKGNIGAELDKVAARLKSFGDGITNVGKKLAGIGAAVTAPLLLAAQRFAAMGDEINKASQRTGVGVESLSALKYAAEQSGASFEDLEAGIRKMEKAVFEAENGSKGAQEALASLGLTAEQLKGKSPDEQFKLIADGLSRVSDSGAQAAISMELFGKGGTKLLPMLQGGAAGIKQLTDRANELGLVIGGKDAEAATIFGDTLKDLWDQINAVTFQIGAAVAQALQPFATAATHILKTIIDWAAAHRPLIIAVLAAGAAFLAAGVALIGLGATITLVGTILGGITAVFAAVGGAIAFLVNPIVLVIAGLVGLGAYFAYTTGFAGEALAWLGEKFGKLKDIATEAFGGIADALKAGDIQLAGEILWAGLQLLWIEGTQELQNVWIKFKAGFVQVAGAAFYGALEIWETVKAGLKEGWASLVDYMSAAWQKFASTYKQVWAGIASLVSGDLIKSQARLDVTTNVKAGDTISAKALQTRVGLNAKDAAQFAGRPLGQDDINAIVEKVVADRLKSKTDVENKDAAQRAQDDADAAVQREKDKNAAILKARQDLEKNMKELNDAEMALSAGADENAKKEIADLQKRKDDLQKQLAELRKQAATEGKKADDQNNGHAPLFDPKLNLSIDDIVKNRDAVASPAKSAGIFNPFAIQSLQTTPMLDVAKKQQKSLENIDRNTKKKASFA